MSGFATRDAVQASRRALRAAGYAAELTPNNTLTVAGQASEAEAQRLAAQVHIWDDKHSRQSISRLAKCRSVITLWCCIALEVEPRHEGTADYASGHPV